MHEKGKRKLDGKQCCEIEENLWRNSSKRAYQFVKDLTTVKQGKATTVQDSSVKCLTEEQETLNRWTDHEGTVSIRGRTITNLRFADDIDGLAREEGELAN